MTANTNETNKIQLCEYSVLEGKLAMAYQIWDEMMDRGMANGDDEYFDKLTSELEAQLDSCPKPSDRKSKKSAEVELPEAPTVEPKKDKDGNAIVKVMSAKELRSALTTFRDENNVSLKCILGGKGYSAEAMANEYLRVTGYTFQKALTKSEQAKLDKAARPIAPTVAPNGKTIEFSGIELKKAIQPYGVAHRLNVKVTASFDDLAAEFLRITGTQVTKKATKADIKKAEAAAKKAANGGDSKKKAKVVTLKVNDIVAAETTKGSKVMGKIVKIGNELYTIKTDDGKLYEAIKEKALLFQAA